MTGIHREVAGHLVRRAVSLYPDHVQDKTPSNGEPLLNISPAHMLLVFFTFTAFLVVYASIRYTLGVVATLAMIESPSTSVLVLDQPPRYQDEENTINKNNGPDEEVLVVQEKPITSSIRGTIRHLTRIGGFKARWRGLGIFIVYSMIQLAAFSAVRPFFTFLIGSVLGSLLASIISAICFARIHMTWTQIMISTPSPLPWYRRIPGGRTYFKVLLVPTAICAIAEHLTVLLPIMVSASFGPLPETVNHQITNTEVRRELLRFVATIATTGFVALAILLPATVTLTRVEASLLPDDAETIVSFDRTLGGAAANLVGFGKVNFRALYDAAWRSFDRSSRIRLIKFFVKYSAILLIVMTLFFSIMFGEFLFIFKDKLAMFVDSASAQLQMAALEQNGM